MDRTVYLDNNATTYTISGVAWLDANQNGARESSEELLSGIKLYAKIKWIKNLCQTEIKKVL